ncbi:hypothetical protein [Rhodococcus chondri]|uniref:Uncharacterized protein n=1 Tax=Rhodococcus chondri TaxID=3065941 RepID=A0ABU7JLX9_9NOCA|nr:hypothetical protein [Rhodococcus sp. CC-R104]MEE2030712.1 hypothetical protein [Rhodococcus sp. CC-R104]
MTTSSPLLGTIAGVTTAVLAVAAHGAAGGGIPTGPTAALLLAIAVGVGMVGAQLPAMPPIVLLAAGQAGTHVVLNAVTTGHMHAPAAMFTAHVVAVALCAMLLGAARRLYDACSRAVRAVLTFRTGVASLPRILPRTSTDRLVGGRAPPNISRRGPPAATCCA